jgi:FHS family glucose/mannose:H+ symporter-like MFS transporter
MYDRARMTSTGVQPLENTSAMRQNQARRTLAAVFLYFPVVGVATVMLGPVLPVLAARWAMTDAQLGTLFFASFIGQFCGAWFAARRLGVSLFLAAVGASLGCIMLAYAGAAAAHFALLVLGLGLGAGMAAGNIVVGRVSIPEAVSVESSATGAQRSRLLAWLNASWGLGAIACPLLVAASLRLHGYDPFWATLGFSSTGGGQLFFLALALAFAICAALILRLLPREMYRRAPLGGSVGRMPALTLWLFVAVVILYVGTENALGGWLPTYAGRLAAGAGTVGRVSSVAFCFWSAELLGRAATAVLVKRVNERMLYQAALAILILASATLFLTSRLSTASVFALTIVAALSLAPLYPLVVSLLIARAGNDPRLGRVFASSSLGGTTLPWLTGIVSTHSQSLRIGLVVPAMGAVLMLLLSMYLPRVGDDELASSTRGDR